MGEQLLLSVMLTVVSNAEILTDVSENGGRGIEF